MNKVKLLEKILLDAGGDLFEEWNCKAIVNYHRYQPGGGSKEFKRDYVVDEIIRMYKGWVEWGK